MNDDNKEELNTYETNEFVGKNVNISDDSDVSLNDILKAASEDKSTNEKKIKRIYDDMEYQGKKFEHNIPSNEPNKVEVKDDTIEDIGHSEPNLNDLIKSFIGYNEDKIMHNNFSWPGFFFNGLYISFRKMLFLGIVIETILVLGLILLYKYTKNIYIVIGSYFGFSLLVGLFANKTYLSKAKRKAKYYMKKMPGHSNEFLINEIRNHNLYPATHRNVVITMVAVTAICYLVLNYLIK